MSFREKSAWITLVTLVLLTTLFCLHIPYPFSLTMAPSPFIFHVLGGSVVGFVVIVTVAHILVAIRAPREARAPKDERERLIELRSTAIAAYVYGFLSLSSIFTIHLGANQIGIAYLVFLSFIFAEIVNYGLRVFFYRRGF
jgi:heme/copper-type cytochrome/quinol oxidase subunit 2